MSEERHIDSRRLLFEAFEAAGADEGLIYVSVPITSGPRELGLMRELGCTREELRAKFQERWRREVLEPNEEEARTYGARARVLFPHHLVVEPARIHVSDWTQDDYNSFWLMLIEKYALKMIVAPDWPLSVGARLEVASAIQLMLPIADLSGNELSAEQLVSEDQRAHASLLANGWTESQVQDLFKPLTLNSGENGSRLAARAREAEVTRSAAEVFGWLRAERAYQLDKFGVDTDDEHSREGINDGSWWDHQLTMYLHRARVLTLDQPNGRQALAKFVATGCGLLESVVRVFGHLPQPGVPSGYNTDAAKEG